MSYKYRELFDSLDKIWKYWNNKFVENELY